MTCRLLFCEFGGAGRLNHERLDYCGALGSVWRALAMLLALCALAGCVSAPRLGGDPALRVVHSSELPAPDPAESMNSARPYYVGPYDKLTIDVYGMPGLANREVQVDASGKITYPLAGAVAVSGRTTREIEQLMAERLQANFLRNPQVTVLLKENASQLVTVDGQVARPGRYPVIGEMSLVQVMSLAGGTNDNSKLDDVVIFRTVNGQKLAALYDLKAIRHGQYADPEVFANDVVMVGDNVARRYFKDLLQAVPIITGPLIVAIQSALN